MKFDCTPDNQLIVNRSRSAGFRFAQYSLFVYRYLLNVAIASETKQSATDRQITLSTFTF